MDHLVLHTRVVSGAGGGPEKTILNSPRFLENQGYPMVLAYMRHPDDQGFKALEARALERGVNLAAIDDFGPLDWQIVGRFRKLCETHRPAIWHAHDYKSGFLGLLLRRHLPDMKLVTTTHGWVEQTWKTPLYYAIDRHSLKRYDHVVCVSEDLYESVRTLGVPPQRCTYIHNAIDVDDFTRQHSAREAKIEQGLDPDRLIVGAVGRLSPEKGFDRLIEAFSGALEETQVNAELWIVGAGSQADTLRDLAARQPQADRIKLKGFCSDIKGLFETLDAFVLSSIREGLPNVVLEAMAMSVPMVCTQVAGVPSLVTHDEHGLTCPTADTSALQDCLSRLLTDPELRQRLAAAGRRRIEESYSFALRMEKMRRVYDQVLGLDLANVS